MTTEEEFRKKITEILEHLDTTLPKGSNLIMTGLADGSILWDLLDGRIHPLGHFRQDVEYGDIYGYLNCLQVSPCHGWMTDDADLRTIKLKT